MDVSIEYDKEKSICYVRVVGKITNRDDVRYFYGKTQPTMRQHSCSRVLFDIRDAEIVAGTMDIYLTAANPEDWGWVRSNKAAIVYSNITPDHCFLENVAVNRGYYIKIFDNVDKALLWLSGSEKILAFDDSY
jgi:hypothetical protein